MDLFADDLTLWTGGSAPFIHSILYHAPGIVCFHGDMYREPETMPIERVLTSSKREYHVEITSISILELLDDCNDQDLSIPLWKMEMNYRIIAVLEPTEAVEIRRHCMSLIDAEVRRDRWYRQRRLWEDWVLEVKFNRNLSFTAGSVDSPPALTPSSPTRCVIIGNTLTSP